MLSNEAFEKLIQNHQPDAYKFALSLCKNETDAEDFVQDAFIHAYEHRADYDPARPFVPWLFTIVRHKFLDRVRKEARSPMRKDVSIHGDETAEPMDVVDTRQRTPDEMLDDKVLREAVEQLPERQRLALSYYCEGYTQTQIAELMDTSQQNADRLIKRAIKNVRGTV